MDMYICHKLFSYSISSCISTHITIQNMPAVLTIACPVYPISSHSGAHFDHCARSVYNIHYPLVYVTSLFLNKTHGVAMKTYWPKFLNSRCYCPITFVPLFSSVLRTGRTYSFLVLSIMHTTLMKNTPPLSHSPAVNNTPPYVKSHYLLLALLPNIYSLILLIL